MDAPLPPPAPLDAPRAAPPAYQSTLPPPPPLAAARCVHGNDATSCIGCAQNRSQAFFDERARAEDEAEQSSSIFGAALRAARARQPPRSAEEEPWTLGRVASMLSLDDLSPQGGTRGLGALGAGIPRRPPPVPTPAGLPVAFAAAFDALDLETALAAASTEEVAKIADVFGAAGRRCAVELARRSIEEENVCVVCLDRKKNCVLMNCFHVATCTGCASKIDACPACRAPVVQHRRIFTA